VIATPEEVKFTTSGMHAVPVDPQLAVFTVPKVNGTPPNVNVGGVVELELKAEPNNCWAEYASGQLL
jgi:hypothetical protein